MKIPYVKDLILPANGYPLCNFNAGVLRFFRTGLYEKGDVVFENDRENFNSVTYWTMSLLMYCPIAVNTRTYSEIYIKSCLL